MINFKITRLFRKLRLPFVCVKCFSAKGCQFYSDLRNYKRFLSGSKKNASITPKIHGINYNKKLLYYRTYSTDVVLISEIITGRYRDDQWIKEYDVDISNISIKALLDLGANIGVNTVKFASMYPHAKIVAVEPEKDNFAVLEKNVSGYKNVSVICCGVWSKNTHLQISDPGTGSWGFTVKESESGLEGRSIDSICEEHDIIPDVIKMDIEGSEMEVFKTIDESKWIKHLKILMIETHEWLAPGCDQLVRKKMRDNGFEESKQGGIYVFRKL